MSDTLLRFSTFYTQLRWWREHAAPGYPRNLLILHTPAESHWPRGKRVIPATYPASTGITIKILWIRTPALSLINAVTEAYCSSGSVCVWRCLLLFCGIKDRYYRFPPLFSPVCHLAPWWNRNCRNIPVGPPHQSCVFRVLFGSYT